MSPLSSSPSKHSRWRRRVNSLLAVSLCLGVIAYWKREYLKAGYWEEVRRAYYYGRTQMAAFEYGPGLQEIDEVEVLALGGEAGDGQPDSFPNDMGPPTGTVNRQTLRDADAKNIAANWRVVPIRPLSPLGWCHHPYYALRFRDHGKLVLETSVCWKCGTYSLPVKEFGRSCYGFDPKSDSAQKLLASLTNYAPHPEPPPK